MTAVLFDYPKKAAFGRVLPKNKIYEHGSPSAAVKQLFVRQVEQIVWQYKLAPEKSRSSVSRSRGTNSNPRCCAALTWPFPSRSFLSFGSTEKYNPLLPLSGQVKRMPASGLSANISMAIGQPPIRHASPCRWFSTSRRFTAIC